MDKDEAKELQGHEPVEAHDVGSAEEPWMDSPDESHVLDAIPIIATGPNLAGRIVSAARIQGLSDIVFSGDSTLEMDENTSGVEGGVFSTAGMVWLDSRRSLTNHMIWRILSTVNSVLKQYEDFRILAIRFDTQRLHKVEFNEIIDPDVKEYGSDASEPNTSLTDSPAEILAELLKSDAERPQVTQRLLAQIGALSTEIQLKNEALDLHVQAARLANISWRQIGEAVHISSTTALRRWDPKAKQKHADYERNRTRRDPNG